MRYPRKFVKRVGLVPSLLIVGVLGGLMAPLFSEAAGPSRSPTITLRMDSGSPLTLSDLAVRTCSSSDVSPGGYNYCYTVPTGGTVTGTGGFQYRIDPNGTPRVRIADKNGQDKISLTGVQFVPVGTWPNTESHTLTLTLSATLDATTDGVGGATINETNAGNYKWAVRSSGEFIANANSDSVGNSLTLAGVGTFSTAKTDRPILSTENAVARRGTKNLTTLSFTVTGDADTADVNWGGLSNADMGQVDLYFPEFNCTRDYAPNALATACRPTITQTLTATIKGRDTLRVLGGPLDVMCVKCTETFGAQQTKQILFLKGAVKVLKIVVPHIQNQPLKAKLQNLTNQLGQILLSINTSSQDTECPGGAVLSFNLGVEAAIDALTLVTRSSTPVVPAPLHHYAVVDSPGLTWQQARDAANLLGPGCDLATITAEAEQAIINGLLPPPTSFTGTKQYWIGGEQVGVTESGGNWQWINEEGIFWNSEQEDGQNGAIVGMYANWGNETNGGTGADIQPDNLGGQNHLSLDNRYGWAWDDNDQFLNGIILGYITEGTTAPCVPPPVIIE